jgi:ADP-ribosylation factor GTPase-activating protein 2/3
MGVHISFVRSIQLDAFTADQIRVFKVGGNQAAKEYFASHGAANINDAKSKYTSRAATMYKEKLLRAVEVDKAEFPTGIVIKGMFDNDDAASVDSKSEDFFSDWELKSNSRSLQSSPVPPIKVTPNQNNSPAKKEEGGYQNSKKEEEETIGYNTARKASLSGSSEHLPIFHHKPATSNIIKPNKRSMGAKKATKIINFDEAERIAKEEEKERIRLEEQAKKEGEAVKAAMLNRKAEITQLENSRNSSAISKASEAPRGERPGSARLGFGFDASAPKKKPQESRPAPTSSFGFGGAPSGFGSIGHSNNSNEECASTRFGKAKGISSDQYFGRGAFDEAEKYVL